MAVERKYLSLDKLGLYDTKIKAKIAADDATTLQSAKDYADSLAVNYEEAGAAATAEANAKAYADGKDAAIAAAKKAGDDAAAAAAVADGKAVAAQTTADEAKAAATAVDTYVGDIPEGYDEETVIEYINKKAEETLNAASGGSSESAASVKAALDTEIARAKAAEQANATAAAEAKSAADAAQSHSEGVAGDLAEAVEALEGADESQVERIAALEGQIVGLSGAMHFKGIIEGEALPETTEGYSNGDVVIFGNKEYVVNNGAFVEFGDVSAQAEAITELTGRMDTAEGDIEQLQKDVDAAEEAIALKAAQTALDEAVEALEEADAGQIERIEALEGKFGGAEGSVEDMIADAKAAAIEAAAADAATKDEAILAAAKKYADDEDARIESRVDALEADTHTHANKALLDTYTQTEADLADAVAKKHEHANKEALDAVTAAKIAAWDAAEANAKAYADAEVAKDRARLDAVEAWQTNMKEITEDEVNALFPTA